MTKIKANVIITSPEEKIEYQVDASINEEKNTIIYYEKDSEKTKVKYDYEKKILIRENKNLSMKYYFDLNNETQAEVMIKDLNKRIVLPINTIDIIRNFWNVLIKYQIERQNFEYKIEVIE